MSTLHDRLRCRMALVRRDLNEVIGRLENVPMDWAPLAGMRTVGGQLLEITATEEQIYIWLNEGKLMKYQDVHSRLEKSTLEEYKASLAEIRDRTLGYLDLQSIDDLHTQIDMPDDWSESLLQNEVPRAEVFRSIAQHEWYHTGQLVSYMWMRGDDPYDW